MSVRDWKGTAKMTVKKLGEIIGTTTDTGGTATAGTLMAKVNAILNTVVSGVKVSGEVTIKETAQTKKFTETQYLTLDTSYKTITGCGMAIICCRSGQTDLFIKIDGSDEMKFVQVGGNDTIIYFEESISLKSGSSSNHYAIIRT